jgi:plasmid stabilization system protein ParE
VVVQAHYIIPYRLKDQRIELLAVMHDAREWPEGFGEDK